RCENLSSGDNPNYMFDRAILSVSHGGEFLGTLTPERRFYKASQQQATSVAIRSSLREDLYVVFAGRDPE
ncbi:heme lyase CcmF/NrfE family subunit, partial [Acidobacteriia bacterium AH_259_A11_L15]|nr:heme lyase CcmF/NrfE family subunit [Acidobacteriia bacterium AH_259_A11_L15]